MSLSRSIFIPLFIMVLVWQNAVLAESTPKFPDDNAATDEQEDRELKEMYREYEQELPQLVRPGAKASLMPWENEFKKALANNKGSSSLRLRIMDALGATQIALGKKDDALITYEEMEEYAESAGNLAYQVTAGSKQLDLLALSPIEKIEQTIERLEDSVELFVKQSQDDATKKRYSDIMLRIGILLNTRANANENVENSTKLLKHAKTALEKAIESVSSGKNPSRAAQMYWLAQTQSKLGQRVESAATYGKIANMNQPGFSRLWMEYLRICETTRLDSPGYLAAIERVLRDFSKHCGTDDYELTLRRQLGQSYRRVKEYAKSTEILISILGRDNDPDAQAYDRLLIAQNARDTQDIDTARKHLEEAIAKYPKTSAGQTAKKELHKPLYQPKSQDTESVAELQEHKRSWRGILIGANLVAIVILAPILVVRQMKKKEAYTG